MPPEGIGGPYREPANPNALALENMRKKIEAEKKHGIFLQEGIKEGDKILGFVELIKQKINPGDIAFYSVATGVLTHLAGNKKTSFYIYGNDGGSNQLYFTCERQTAVVSRFDTEEKRKKRKEREEEENKKDVVRSMYRAEEEINYVNKKTFPMDNFTIKECLPQIKELKRKLDILVQELETRVESEKK